MFLGSQMATGGSQRMLLTMARWFYEQGYPVTVAFFHDREGLRSHWQAGFPIEIHDLRAWRKGDGLGNLFHLPAGLLRLARLLQRQQVHAIMSFTHHANLLGIPLAWMLRLPVRIAGHRGVIGGFPRWMERLHAWMVNCGMATCMVAVSERLKEHAISVEKIHPGRIQVIENGIALGPEEPVPPQALSDLKHQLGMGAEDILIFTVGRLAPQKGQWHLLDAFAQILPSFPHAFLAIAGEGELRPRLESQAQSLGISARVRLLGVRRDVPQLLRLAQVFVLPSLWEGMPVSLIEAMAAGLPVITTRVEGIDELVQDGVNGLTIPPANPEELARTLQNLLGNPELRQRLSAEARRSIQQKFTVSQMCQKYEKLILQHWSDVKN